MKNVLKLGEFWNKNTYLPAGKEKPFLIVLFCFQLQGKNKYFK